MTDNNNFKEQIEGMFNIVLQYDTKRSIFFRPMLSIMKLALGAALFVAITGGFLLSSLF